MYLTLAKTDSSGSYHCKSGSEGRPYKIRFCPCKNAPGGSILAAVLTPALNPNSDRTRRRAVQVAPQINDAAVDVTLFGHTTLVDKHNTTFEMACGRRRSKAIQSCQLGLLYVVHLVFSGMPALQIAPSMTCVSLSLQPRR
jgi:hypothetical protein